MGLRALLFDKLAAVAALKTWAEFVLGGIYSADEIRRGNRNAPANSQAQVTITPITSDPIEDGWLDVVQDAQQRNLVHVEVVAVAPGAYTVGVLSSLCTYTAGALDSATTIRDGLRAEVDALLGPLTTSIVGPAAFSILGNVAGQWLAARSVTPNITTTVIDDVLRRTHWRDAKWTLRIAVDAIRPAAGASLVVQAMPLIRSFLAAPESPVVNGSAVLYTGDYLRSAGLVVLTIGDPLVGDYSTGGPSGVVWRERATVDVVFTTRTGLAFDLPTIESFGVPTISITQ